MTTIAVRCLRAFACLLAFSAISTPHAFALGKGVRVPVPAGLQHEAWDGLLKKYVNQQGLVAYEKWKASETDRKALDEYLAQFGKAGTPAKGDDLAASAINAYNAFAIRWILENYPTESIMALPNSFSRKAHLIGGQKFALDDLEHGTLRPAIGYRTHSALVCCARSCPPLQRNAYTAAALTGQIDTAYTTWLARGDLNQFEPEKNKVSISSIFKWFKEDFEAAGGVPKILGQYGPEKQRAFLAKGGYKIEILPYRWGLNDQGGHGEKYSSANLYFDALFK
ncbi:MAG: hypothetical protein QOE70_3612 [Chthoniobacter sp.]|jgi:hypothetical protein|nr:hypothetical protein [Chthoniobacter sp.]